MLYFNAGKKLVHCKCCQMELIYWRIKEKYYPYWQCLQHCSDTLCCQYMIQISTEMILVRFNFIIFRPYVNFLLQLIGKVIRLVVRHCLHSFFSEIAARLKVILYCFILQTIDYIWDSSFSGCLHLSLLLP